MGLRSRPVVAVLGLAVGALVAVSGCGTLPRQAAPAPNADSTAAPTTAPTTSPSTATESSRPSARQAGPSAPAPKPTPAPTAPKKTAPPAPTKPAALMKTGSTGDRVRELQHRLRQLDWFSGTITGSYGQSTAKGVTGFQDKRSLQQTGEVDQKTWTKLTAMTRKPSNDEMHNKVVAGPAILKSGANGDRVRNLQVRLKQLDWFDGEITGTYGSITTTAVRGFQGKRGLPATGEVDQKTWDKLTGMTKTPSKDQMYNRVPSGQSTGSTRGLDSRCLTGRVMCISKDNNSITWVVDGKAKLRMDVRFGSDETPTRNGLVPGLPQDSERGLDALPHADAVRDDLQSAVKRCTTRPTSPPAATTAPRTAA